MAQVGTVKEISGIVKAVDSSGAVRVLAIGDTVDAGELVVTVGDGSSVKLSFESGRELTLGSEEKALLDESVFASEGFDNADVQVTQNALLNGEELPTEATAAGDTGATADGGFVPAYVAGRTDERGDVSSYNLSTDGPITPGVDAGFFDPANTAPEALDDDVIAYENVLFSGNIFDNDTDDGLPNPPNDLDLVSINGIGDTNGDGFITITTEFGELNVNVETGAYEYLSNYDPLAYGENVIESFDYVVTDGQLTSTATLNITLNGTNDQPQVEALVNTGWLLSVGSDSQGEDEETFNPKALTTDSSVGVDEINAFIATGAESVVVTDVLDPSEIPTNGSALKLFVSVETGETVNFNWTFFDAEGQGNQTYNDFSFVVIDGQEIQLLANAFEPGATNNGVFSYTFVDAGIHEITFGVMNEDDTAVNPSLQVIHTLGGEIVNIQTIGIVQDSGATYETSDIDETDTNGDDIVANDEGLSVLSGSLIATDIDTSDTHLFRLVDIDDEGAMSVSYDSGNGETNTDSEIQILVTSPDIDIENINIQGITLLNNEQGDRVSEFEIRGDFGALGVGESATITFQFVADDMHGFVDGELPNESSISEVQIVTMTIMGTNDQPIVENISVTVTEASLADIPVNDGQFGGQSQISYPMEDYSYSGQLTVSDDDVNDSGLHIFEWDPSSVQLSITTSNAIILDIIAQHGVTPLDAESFVEEITQGYVDFSYADANEDNTMDSATISTTVALPEDLVLNLIDMGILVINVQEDGSYTISSPLFNLLGANDTVTIDFNYRADDTRGMDGTDGYNENSVSDWATMSLTIEGTNDRPVASPYETLALESSLSNVDVNGDQVIDEDSRFEGMLPGAQEEVHDLGSLVGRLFSVMDEDLLDIVTMKYFQGEAEVTTVGAVLNADGVTPIVDATQTVVVVNENGTFSIENPTFDNLAYGESVTVTFDYYIDDMSDNDTGEALDSSVNPHELTHSEPATVTVVITGTNDQPVIQSVATTQENYYEEMGVPSNSEDAREITGSLTTDFADDDTNDIPNLHYVSIEDNVFNAQDNDELSALVNLQVINEVYNATALDINAEDISLNLDENGNFTLTSDKFNSLGAGESLDVTFNVKITDESNSANGESTESETKLVTVHIEGTNDQPVISDVFAGGIEQGVVTYTNDIDMRIPSAGTSGTISSTIDIADGGSISDLNVHINLTHTYDADLEISLRAPDGTVIDLTSDNGGSANNYTNTVFDDEAAMSVTAGLAPFSGTFRPEGNLSDFDGMDMSGTWTLIIVDDAGLDSGILYDWSLEFTANGQQVIYESHDNEAYQNGADDTQDDMTTTYTASLTTVVDDDVNDTHEYFKDIGTENVASTDIDPNLITDLQISVTTAGEYTVAGNFNALGVGERATVTFDYYAKDSSVTQLNGESNISESQTVTVVITGTNDQPVVENVAFTAIETHDSDAYQNGLDDTRDDVNTTLVGTLIATDDDVNDTHIFNVLDIDADTDTDTVSVTYNNGIDNPNSVDIGLSSSDVDIDNLHVESITLLNNDAEDSQVDFEIVGNFNALGAGESATVTFKYYADDRQGQGESGDAHNEASISEAKIATITITGTNDQPVIQSIETQESLETDLTSVSYGVDTQVSTGDLADALAEGSALSVVVDTATGEEVSFDWAFDLRDDDYMGDSALVIIDGVVTKLADGTIDANGTFTHTFATAGEHTISVVVLNNHDNQAFGGSSELSVTNLTGGVVVSTESFGAVSGSIAAGGFDLSANSDLPSTDLAAFVSTSTVTYENAHLSGNLESLITVTDDDDNDDYTYVAFSDKIVTDVTEVSSGDPLITTPIRVSVDADGNYEVVSSSFDKLGEGESVTIKFDIQVQDDSGVGEGTSNDESSFSETKTITMVITGTNDTPEIVSIDTTEPISEATLVTDFSIENYYHISNSIDLLSKTILNDEDLNDTHTLELANPRAGWDGGIYSDDAVYQFDLANSNGSIDPLIVQNAGVLQVTAAFLNEYPHIDAEIGDFLLYGSGLNNMGVGETATLTFAVIANDGSTGLNAGESNLSAPYMVTINIEGTNDQPTVEVVTVSATEAIGTDTDTVITGTFLGNDEDINDSLTYSVHSMDVAPQDASYLPYYINGTYMGMIAVAVTLASGSEIDVDDLDLMSLNVVGSNFTLVGDFDTIPDGESLDIQFKYSAQDDSGVGAGNTYDEQDTSNMEVVTVTVTGTNDTPIISYEIGSDILGLLQEDNILAQVVYGDLDISDPDAGESEFQPYSDSTSSYGTFEVNEAGSWAYTLDNVAAQALSEGQEVVETYTVYSEDGTSSQEVTIKIYGTNDAPVVLDVSGIGDEDNALSVVLSATDVDGDVVSFTIGTEPNHGSLWLGDTQLFAGSVINATANSATVTFVPDENWSGDEAFTYSATDDSGAVALIPATATITITPVADAPILNATFGAAVYHEPVTSELSLGDFDMYAYKDSYDTYYYSHGKYYLDSSLANNDAILYNQDGSGNGVGVTSERFNSYESVSAGAHVIEQNEAIVIDLKTSVTSADITFKHAANDTIGWEVYDSNHKLVSYGFTPHYDGSDAERFYTIDPSGNKEFSYIVIHGTSQSGSSQNGFNIKNITAQGCVDQVGYYEYAMALSAMLIDTDGSEILSNVTLSNLPSDVSVFVNGVEAVGIDGAYTVELTDTITVQSDAPVDLGSIVTSITSTEIYHLDAPNDITDDSAITSVVSGNLNSDITMGDGNDSLHVGGDIQDSTNIVMGAGNDTITLHGEIDANVTIDFGAGEDTLILDGVTSVDLSHVENLEVVSLKNTTLTSEISAEDVFNINENHTLTITGDSASSVDISGWVDTGNDVGNASVYSAVYGSEDVTLIVDNDLSIVV